MTLTRRMSAKKNIVTLSQAEREALKKVSCSNHRSIREKTRARILLLADVGCSREQGASRTDSEIARHLACVALTVSIVRAKAYVRGAVAAVAHKEQQQRKARKLDGRQEAQLVALTCSTPPEGYSRWSLVLLRERMIEMEIVEHIGLETIRTTLKKTRSSRG